MGPKVTSFVVDGEGSRFLGPGPARLLAAVRETGSLRAAAASMDMAYTKALSLLANAESALGLVLTVRTVGGEGGGGSTLTPAAIDLLDRYEAWERSVSACAADSFRACFAGLGDVGRLGCVVMASGEGSRFGSDKLVARLAGDTVIAHTLAALPPDLLDVVVVTRWPEVASVCEDLGVACVTHDGAFQSDTVRRGLDEMGDRAGCLFVPGDQPLLTAASVRALTDAFVRDPSSVWRLAWRGRPASPVLFGATCFPALRALEGDVGGVAALRERPELAERVRLVEAVSADELLDVDTPEDLERVERILDVARDGMTAGKEGRH